MTLRLDDGLMFRDALDGVHGLDPALRTTLGATMANVVAAMSATRWLTASCFQMGTPHWWR